MTHINLILDTDSYKTSHYLQYPPGTKYVRSYIEPRGKSKNFPGTGIDGVVNLGLSAYVQKLRNNPITSDDINEAEELITSHGLPFNRKGWEHILRVHDGFLPLHIEALPEGTVIPLGTCQVQVINTDPEVPWLTSYVETSLLRAIWYPSTVGTISREIKRMIKDYMKITCDTLDKLPFMLHDFGSRGVSSQETAGIGGFAHLVNFQGTDTLEAIMHIRKYYSTGNPAAEMMSMPGFSIPAAEHSTITAWGEENEHDAFRNMVTQFGGKGAMLAVVSDSYDIEAACRAWGTTLKDDVLGSKATVIVRPDSGHPATMVLKCLDILAANWGTINSSKGFKLLHPSIRVIQGDGINYSSISDILFQMYRQGWATENLAFGMGGALGQHCDRDWLNYAMKANQINVDGKWRDIYKRPASDTGKASKAGHLIVKNLHGNLVTKQADGWTHKENLLVTHYNVTHDGTHASLDNLSSLEEIRERAK